MSETTVLQIRTHGSTTVRSLELTGPSVRIGRGAQCEVRLGEPGLAEVQCLLRRRGGIWHIQPVGPPGRITLNGVPVESQRSLPMGVSLRVGDHWLLLGSGEPPPSERPSIRISRPEYPLGVSRPLDSEIWPEVTEPMPSPTPTGEPLTAAQLPSVVSDREPLSSWEARLQQRTRSLKIREVEQRWESRWRAAGENLRSPTSTTTNPPTLPIRDQETRPGAASPPSPPSRGEPLTRQAVSKPFSIEARAPLEVVAPRDTRNLAPRSSSDVPSARHTMPSEPSLSVPLMPRQRPVAPPDVFEEHALRPSLSLWSESAPQEVADDPLPETSARFVFSETPTLVTLPNLEAWVEERETLPESETLSPIPNPIVDSSSELSQPSEQWLDSEPDSQGSSRWSWLRTPTIRGSFLDTVGLLGRFARSARPLSDDNSRDETAGLDSSPSSPDFSDSSSPPNDPFPAPAEAQRAFETIASEALSATGNPDEITPILTPGVVVESSVAGLVDFQTETVTSIETDELSVESLASLVTVATFVESDRSITPLTTLDTETEPIDNPPRLGATGGRAEARLGALGESARLSPGQSLQGSEWPSAHVILQSAGARTSPVRHGVTHRTSLLPMPTVSQVPGHWCVPGLPLFWLLAVAATLVVGGAGLTLAWVRAWDDATVGPIADRLLADKTATAREQGLALAPSPFGGHPSWWNSTAEGLWLRAWAIDRPDAEPERTEALDQWLRAARATAPASPTVRYALARRARVSNPDQPASWPVGLSRDVLSLALTGGRLLSEGKAGSARHAYRTALEMACRIPVVDESFDFDEKETRRYRLPHESLLEVVISDMEAHGEWDFSRWSEALPGHGAAALVAARVLQSRNHLDSHRALEWVQRVTNAPAPEGCSQAVHLAARAESFALQDRLDDAMTAYREAIDACSEGTLRRVLSHNLAELAIRRGDETTARAALEAAHGSSHDDSIGRRAQHALAEIDRSRRGAFAGRKTDRQVERTSLDR